jgi:hypothetical protein
MFIDTGWIMATQRFICAKLALASTFVKSDLWVCSGDKKESGLLVTAIIVAAR